MSFKDRTRKGHQIDNQNIHARHANTHAHTRIHTLEKADVVVNPDTEPVPAVGFKACGWPGKPKRVRFCKVVKEYAAHKQAEKHTNTNTNKHNNTNTNKHNNTNTSKQTGECGISRGDCDVGIRQRGLEANAVVTCGWIGAFVCFLGSDLLR